MAHASITCPTCGVESPGGANFCANCGQRLSETPEPVAYTHSPPKLFGVLSPGTPFVLGCLLLAGALVALVLGSLVLGILLLAGSAAFFVLFYGAAERDTASPVVRGVVTARDRLRGWTAFTTESVDAWAKAGRDVVKLRGELRAMRREHAQARAELGDAAYREDDTAVASLRGRLRELEDAIAQRQRERAQALARARDRVERERRAIHQTEVIAPEDRERARGADEP